MDVLKVVILDDELAAIENLKNILHNFVGGIEIIAAFNHPSEALEKLGSLDFDVLFLDIQMPGLNGFELLKALGEVKFQVVFVTAHEKYALRAFRSNAVDYILKPINTEDLKQTLSNLQKAKLLKEINGTNLTYNRSLLNFFDSFDNHEKYQTHLTIRSGDSKIKLVATSSIIRLIATNQGAVFHLSSGEQLLSGMSLTECESILDPGIFIRCHISHIINKNSVSEIRVKRTGTAYLNDGSEVPISARRKSEVLKHF